MLSRNDEQGSQMSGMRVSLYIFESSQEGNARLRCCPVFHGPRYHVPKRSSPSTSSIRGERHVGLSGWPVEWKCVERKVHCEGREPLPTISRLTCIPFVTFRIPGNIHVSDLYG